jgi:hypothetical protein
MPASLLGNGAMASLRDLPVLLSSAGLSGLHADPSR